MEMYNTTQLVTACYHLFVLKLYTRHLFLTLSLGSSSVNVVKSTIVVVTWRMFVLHLQLRGNKEHSTSIIAKAVAGEFLLVC